MIIIKTYPHITDSMVVFYGRGLNGKIYVWNPVEAGWVLHKAEKS